MLKEHNTEGTDVIWVMFIVEKNTKNIIITVTLSTPNVQ